MKWFYGALGLLAFMAGPAVFWPVAMIALILDMADEKRK